MSKRRIFKCHGMYWVPTTGYWMCNSVTNTWYSTDEQVKAFLDECHRANNYKCVSALKECNSYKAFIRQLKHSNLPIGTVATMIFRNKQNGIIQVIKRTKY